MVIAGLIYAKYIGKKIYQIPGNEDDEWLRPEYQKPVYYSEMEDDNKNLPSTFRAFAPIIIPIILILISTIISVLLKEKVIAESTVIEVFKFLGAPVIAVGIGLIVSIYALAGNLDRKTVLRSEEHTSELQSRQYLVCRLLLEKKKSKTQQI